MTALEQIEQMKTDGRQMMSSHFQFLMKSFEIMKEIAEEYKKAAGCAHGMIGEWDVDHEFEINMEEFEKRMNR